MTLVCECMCGCLCLQILFCVSCVLAVLRRSAVPNNSDVCILRLLLSVHFTIFNLTQADNENSKEWLDKQLYNMLALAGRVNLV